MRREAASEPVPTGPDGPSPPHLSPVAAVLKTVQQTQAALLAWTYMLPFLAVGPFYAAPPLWTIALMWPKGDLVRDRALTKTTRPTDRPAQP